MHSGGAVLRNIVALKVCGRTREAPVLPCKMLGPPTGLFGSTPQRNTVGRINSLIKVKYSIIFYVEFNYRNV